MPLWCCPPQTPGPDPTRLQIRFVPGADGPINRSGGGRGTGGAPRVLTPPLGHPHGAGCGWGAPRGLLHWGGGVGGSSLCPLGPTEPSGGGDPGVHSIPRGPAASPGGPKAPGGKGLGWEAEHWGHHHPKNPAAEPTPCTHPAPNPSRHHPAPCALPKQPPGGGGPGVGWVPALVWGLISHPKRNQTPSGLGERTCPGSQKYPKPDPRDGGTLPEDPPAVGWLRTRVGHRHPR